MGNPEIRRLRITFAKQGALRYSGHLDLHRVLIRTIRRAKLRLVYSQGFHPQPKIQLAAALPLGFASRAEIMDIWLTDAARDDHQKMAQQLQDAAPPGLTILGIREVDLRGPTLQTQVAAAEYEVTLLDAPDASDLDQRLAAVMDAESLPRERRGKAYDLRPLIYELHLLEPGDDGHPLLFMRLSARGGATGRPEEILSEMKISFENTHIERTRLIFEDISVE